MLIPFRYNLRSLLVRRSATLLTALGVKHADGLPGLNLLDEKAVAQRKQLFGECFTHDAKDLANPAAKSYELSHLRSNTMPQSPFGTPLVDKYRPTVGIPGTLHAFNGEEAVSGEAGAQGTQMDAIGHFAVLPEKWDGKSPFPADKAKYYGDLRSRDAAGGADPGIAHIVRFDARLRVEA